MKQRIFSLLIVAFILLLGSVMLTSCASGGFKDSFAPNMGSNELVGEEEFMFGESYNEINEYTKYNYVVVNDKIDKAVEKVKSIIMAEKCRVDRIEEIYLNTKEEFIHEGLIDKEFENNEIEI